MSGTALSDSVNVQLERILSRPPLATSPSLSRLLRYVVTETLAGRQAEITEYQLGVQVFHRGQDFNPRADPIVRVQTHHLRSRLAQYYAKPGTADSLVIELPPRTYIPVFRMLPEVAPSVEVAVVPATEPAVPAPVEEATAPRETPNGRARGLIVMGVAILLVLGASLGILSRVWRSPAGKKVHEPDPVAEGLYAHGRYLLDRQTEAALRESLRCFQEAVDRDPRFAAAFAGLADANNILAQYGYTSPREGMEEARRAAKQALALDPDLAEAHVSLAAITEAYDWDFKAAEREYRRAIQLNPQLAEAHLWYGMFLRDQERLQEALPELRRAEELEPVSVLASVNLAFAFRMAGDNNAALERAQRAVELNPDFAPAYVLLSSIYRARSETEEADDRLEEARNLSGGNPHSLSILACTYARLGRRADSLASYRELEQLANERYVSPYDLANAAYGLGDEDHAMKWFEEAYRQRSTGIIFLRNEKASALSPRLLSLMKRLGIA